METLVQILSVSVFDRSHLVLVPLSEHSRQCLEWLINTLVLECAHLEKLQAKFVCKRLTVLRPDNNSVFQVNFIGYQNTREIALILLSDTLVPLLK